MNTTALVLGIVLQSVMIAGGVAGLLKLHNGQRELHLTLNSRLDLLLATVAAKSLAEGRALGPVRTEEDSLAGRARDTITTPEKGTT